MLTKVEWKKAPTWARYHSEKFGFLAKEGTNPWSGQLEPTEPRPFDTYPCPFCGETDLAIEKTDWYGDLFYVDCKQETKHGVLCASGPQRRTEAKAWEAWAKRI